ncbi:MAG: aspartate kinase 2, partial [Candidatus Peregrinibacteria bacterium Greene0416_19]
MYTKHMQTITASVEQLLRESPWLTEALGEGIVNLSALARILKPSLEKQHLRSFTDGAVIMALKRVQAGLPTKRARLRVSQTVQSLTVRSNIVQYAFQNSPTLMKAQEKLLQRAHDDEDACVFFARGTFDTGIIVNESLEDLLQKVTVGEKLIKSFRGLSYIMTTELAQKKVFQASPGTPKATCRRVLGGVCAG